MAQQSDLLINAAEKIAKLNAIRFTNVNYWLGRLAVCSKGGRKLWGAREPGIRKDKIRNNQTSNCDRKSYQLLFIVAGWWIVVALTKSVPTI